MVASILWNTQPHEMYLTVSQQAFWHILKAFGLGRSSQTYDTSLCYLKKKVLLLFNSALSVDHLEN